jgi:hypothetical protein
VDNETGFWTPKYQLNILLIKMTCYD